MCRRVAVISISCMMIFSLAVFIDEIAPFVSAPTTYFVGGGGVGNYSKIQWAIDNASDGDTVYVYNGTYIENIIVNKTINLIGEGKNSTIIDGNSNGNTVLIENDGVNISYFAITNSGIFPTDAGIKVRSNFNTIYRNNVSSNLWYGITLDSGSWNNVIDNDIFSNEYGLDIIFSSNFNAIIDNRIFSNNIYNIRIRESQGCIFINNSLMGNGIVIGGDLIHWNNHDIDSSNKVNGRVVSYLKNMNIGTVPADSGQIILANCTNITIQDQELDNCTIGIQLGFSSYNNVVNNSIYTNKWEGILLHKSNENSISENDISYNIDGIRLSLSLNNKVQKNNISQNDYGIDIYYSDTNIVINNTIDQNNAGIHLHESIMNDISKNDVSWNDVGINLFVLADYNYIVQNEIHNNSEGIRLFGSKFNDIYHNNILDNTIQAIDDRPDNFWDNGYPSGGNFWGDYTGVDYFKGPNQDQPGNDGIGDTNYSIDLDSKDKYPLMEPYSNKPLENYSILKQGWNLISIPNIQTNQGITKVLEMIDGYYDAVQWYEITDKDDPWKHYKVGKPSGNDLFELNETIGFWIHITNPGETIFLYNGTEPTETYNITLYKGWNLVGYPSKLTRPPDFGLPSSVDMVQLYNPESELWESWDPGSYSPDKLEYMKPGHGFWVHCTKTSDVWTIEQVIPPTVDYILIVDSPLTGLVEILGQTINYNHVITGYAAAFNVTEGYIGDISVSWSVVNSGGASATTNPITGTSSDFNSGITSGTAIWTADDGDGHTDTVVWTIEP